MSELMNVAGMAIPNQAASSQTKLRTSLLNITSWIQGCILFHWSWNPSHVLFYLSLVTGYKASMVYYIVSYTRIILLNIEYTAYSPHIGTLARTLLVIDSMSSQMHFRWEIPMSTCLIWKASKYLYNKIIFFFLHPISLLFPAIPLYISSLLYFFFPPFSSFFPFLPPLESFPNGLEIILSPAPCGGGG